jgi:SAM-dependent methyltransferase
LADSRAWWDRAARRDPLWHVATGAATSRRAFFRRGALEADALLAFCGLPAGPNLSLVEIGCGVGRMTRRFSERYGRVVALDVSPEMLRRARENLAGATNVTFVLGNGFDLASIGDATADAVFSYITLQHVPSRAAVLRYLEDTPRVLRPQGRAGLQVRRPGWRPTAVDAAGHLWNAALGRQTLSAEWRGTRIPEGELADAVHRGGGRVELRPRGLRHLWVVISPGTG